MSSEGAASVELAFTPTDAERVAVRRYLGRWRWRSAAVTAACVGGVGALVAVDELQDPLVSAVAVFGGAATLVGAAWRLPALQVRRVGPPLEEVLRVDAAGLDHRVGQVRSALPWSAVRGVVELPEGWLLRLGASEGILIPRRAASPALGVQLESWRRGGGPQAPARVPVGFDAIVVSYRATEADYLAFVRRLALRRRPVWAMPVGAFVVLSVALAADRGLDPVALVALALWAGALVVSGGAQRLLGQFTARWQVRRALARDPSRLPAGPVTVGLGPAGGYLHHEGAAQRFAWTDVRSVDVDEVAIVVFFGDEVGLVLPVRAFADGDALAAAARAIEGWRTAMETATPAPVPRRDPGAIPGPFAPPDPE